MENTAYGATMCAERVSIFSAVAGGARRLSGLAVVTADGATPCGTCRQVLSEFADPEALVVLAAPEGAARVLSLGDLFPEPFGRQ